MKHVGSCEYRFHGKGDKDGDGALQGGRAKKTLGSKLSLLSDRQAGFLLAHASSPKCAGSLPAGISDYCGFISRISLLEWADNVRSSLSD